MSKPVVRSFFYCSKAFRTGLHITATVWDGRFQIVNSVSVDAVELGDGVYGLTIPMASGKNGVLIKENDIPSLFTVLSRH